MAVVLYETEMESGLPWIHSPGKQLTEGTRWSGIPKSRST